MPKPKTLEDVYESCVADGMFREHFQVNKEKIKDMAKNAETNIRSAELLIKYIKEEDQSWMNVYTDYYEALRIYTESFIHFHSMKISNHKCLFAYLCFNFTNLKLDWNFFEIVRRKRNGAHYYGEGITYGDWKDVQQQFKFHIAILKKEVEKIH